jgi:hypothetical protein
MAGATGADRLTGVIVTPTVRGRRSSMTGGAETSVSNFDPEFE